MTDLHQGSELEKGQTFIVLICDKDDIKGRMIENGERLKNPEDFDKLWEYSKRKMTDCLMDDFWYAIDAMTFEFETVKMSKEELEAASEQ